MVENFSLLGSLATRLHQEFINIYYLLLPLFFATAIAVDWFQNPQGSPAFLDTVKRAFIATLLVVGFQEISDTILALANGLADRISDMSGLDAIIRMAGEKTRSYPHSPISLVLGFDDLVIGLLTLLSYIILYIARFVTVALYHFMWIFLSILAPVLILFHIFRGTSQITVNLFKSLIEVASYKIVWAVMSAMITALSFGNAYYADGNYLTVILLNFVIATAMLGTPLIVRALVGSGLSSMGGSLAAGATMAMVSAPAKAATVYSAGREAISNTAGFGSYMGSKINDRISSHYPGIQSVSDSPSPQENNAQPPVSQPPLAKS